MLDTAGFSAAENPLFLYKIAQEGDYLYTNALSTTDFGSNRDVSLGKGLLYLAEAFPEFDDASKWETATAETCCSSAWTRSFIRMGRRSKRAKVTPPTSPTIFCGARYLDELNGNGSQWPSADLTKLGNAVDSVWQMESPNGTRAAIGDTFRTTDYQLFFEADLILGTTRWPEVKPREEDVWEFGPSNVSGNLGDPATPASLGNRGQTYELQDAGYYIMRSDNGANADQIIFDAGPTGGSALGISIS